MNIWSKNNITLIFSVFETVNDKMCYYVRHYAFKYYRGGRYFSNIIVLLPGYERIVKLIL